MGRDQLYITVPNLFRCPISLDIMKSPVSLCTGVTYDRSSIQHWLESGHDTCPATMQVLSTKDFVPNLTLLRLINLWTSAAATKSSPLSPAVSEDKVRVWIEEIKNGKCERFLNSIVEFVSNGVMNRRFLVRFDGFVDAIVGVLGDDGVHIHVLESVFKILSFILLENGVNERLHKLIFNSSQNCFNSFLRVLRNGNSESKVEAVAILESITSLNNESKRLVAEKQDLLPVLLELLKTGNDDQDLNEVVLSLLISVSITRSIKTQLVQLGLVQVLSNSLSSQDVAVSVVEKSLKMLSILSTCADGRSAISVDQKCAGAIVERLLKVSKTATEDAVVVLWCMCCLFRDGRVQENVVRSNGLMKVLLVMQSETGEGNVRRMSGDLVKVLRVGCKTGGGGVGSYETKTTHIMPC